MLVQGRQHRLPSLHRASQLPQGRLCSPLGGLRAARATHRRKTTELTLTSLENNKENLVFPEVHSQGQHGHQGGGHWNKNLIKDESGRGPLNFSKERGTKILAVYDKALKYSSGRVLLRIYGLYGFLRPFEMFLTMPPASIMVLVNPFISSPIQLSTVMPYKTTWKGLDIFNLFMIFVAF